MRHFHKNKPGKPRRTKDTAWVLRNRKFTGKMSLRATIVFGAIMIMLFFLVCRLFYLTIFKNYDYTINVLSNYHYSGNTVAAPRGTITDRNGNILAYSEMRYMVIIEPKTILDSKRNYKEPTVQALCKILGMDKAELIAILESKPDSLYYRYKNSDGTVMEISSDAKEKYEQTVKAVNVSNLKKKRTAVAELFDIPVDDVEKEYEKYASFQLQGVWFETCYERVYPYNTLACKVVGFYSKGNQDSSTGIENTYNLDLLGTEGKSYGYLNSDRNLSSETIDPVQGNTIVSTIDVEVQRIVEDVVKGYRDEFGAKNIAAMVMNPNNGEIIAMATDTFYNLNDPTAIPDEYTEQEWNALSDEERSEVLNSKFRNYCISSSYEPGSIFKPLTIAAAFEEGALKGDEHFICGGYKMVGRYRIRCHNRGGCGELDIMGALQNSCNVSLMDIANMLGKKEFSTYFNRFGFGKLTGIDLPNEVSCSSLVYKDFTNQPDVTLDCASFGQGFNVTMVQMAAAFSSLVNGGNYYVPHVVKEIKTPSGETVKEINPDVKFRAVSSLTSEYMKEALFSVVEDGTGAYAKVEGYHIGGKTGTAEMVENGQRLDDLWVASFISAAPIENPELVVYVVVDRTNDEDNYASSKPAQDLTREIWSKILPYYNIHSNLDGYDYLIPEETSQPIDDSANGGFVEELPEETETVPEETVPEETVPEETVPEETAPEEAVPENPVPENPAPEETVPETPVPEETLPENPVPENPAPENPVPENPVPENPVPENPVPENPVPENPVPENPVPENPVPENPVPENPAPDAAM